MITICPRSNHYSNFKEMVEKMQGHKVGWVPLNQDIFMRGSNTVSVYGECMVPMVTLEYKGQHMHVYKDGLLVLGTELCYLAGV